MGRPSIEQQITFLYTRNLSRIAEFYENVMGLPLKLDQGACRIYGVGSDAYLGFCQSENARPMPDEGHQIILTLVTPEVDQWYEVLTEKGVAFEKPPAINERFGIYHCFLRDPDGNLIEIQRFLHPF